MTVTIEKVISLHFIYHLKYEKADYSVHITINMALQKTPPFSCVRHQKKKQRIKIQILMDLLNDTTYDNQLTTLKHN